MRCADQTALRSVVIIESGVNFKGNGVEVEHTADIRSLPRRSLLPCVYLLRAGKGDLMGLHLLSSHFVNHHGGDFMVCFPILKEGC